MQVLTSCEELSLTHEGHLFKAKDSVNLKGCVAFYWLAVLQLKGCRVKKITTFKRQRKITVVITELFFVPLYKLEIFLRVIVLRVILTENLNSDYACPIGFVSSKNTTQKNSTHIIYQDK